MVRNVKNHNSLNIFNVEGGEMNITKFFILRYYLYLRHFDSESRSHRIVLFAELFYIFKNIEDLIKFCPFLFNLRYCKISLEKGKYIYPVFYYSR